MADGKLGKGEAARAAQSRIRLPLLPTLPLVGGGRVCAELSRKSGPAFGMGKEGRGEESQLGRGNRLCK